MIWEHLNDELVALEAEGLTRRRRILDSACGPEAVVDGKTLVSFCSNDYLGLARDASVVDAARVAALRWGVGAGFPTRKSLRFTAELHGERYLNDTITYSGTPIVAADGSILPSVSNLSSPVHAALGLTWQSARGAFVGAGLGWNLNVDGRTDAGSQFGDVTGDAARTAAFTLDVAYLIQCES